jgi:hypothetical protein
MQFRTWMSRFSFIRVTGTDLTKDVGTEASHITVPGVILTHAMFPDLSLICHRTIITEYHRGTRGYLTDTSRIIGEDGSGKDIGTEMKDGGKADMKDLIEETTLVPVMDAADHHLHHPDLREEGTIETTTGRAADNTGCKSQGSGCRPHSA